MSGGLIAERARLSLFVAQQGVHALGRRAQANPLVRWRFSPALADRLVIAPQDLRTADPTRASEIYAGRFAFAGKIVLCDGRSPFAVPAPSSEWAQGLEGFGWLRHLRAADSAITRSHARALVDDWISSHSRWNPVSWSPEVVSRRVISWLSHAPFLLSEADARFYRRFIRSLSRQVRFLRWSLRGMGEGLPQLQAICALNYAALCMAGQARLMRFAGGRLVAALQRQILPDGGHISRNPGALIELLLDLLPLRQAFGARNLPPPPALVNAIERMMPMLRFFRHGDGAFANFNGMGPTPPDLLATVLAYDDARGRPVNNAAHSGYQRLEAPGAVVIVDTGRPPPMPVSQEAHAGCLAFEFSVGRHRLVVNCGLPAIGRESWRHFARTTAAHSTLTLAGLSSCRFLNAPRLQRLIGTPIVNGPQDIAVGRDSTPEGMHLVASHDGYARRCGLVHERRLLLAADGRRLDGEDTLRPARGHRMPRRVPDAYTLRFHLHPAVSAVPLTHRNAVMLTLPNRDVWTFEANEHPVAIEDSVYLAGPHGPQRTTELVIYGNARQAATVSWSFVQLDPAEANRALPRGLASEGPL
ncbi:MAG TPA: heparinase II/III family protein [Xanthobacteraceae bacterium]|nr:heparinase II/III family protein [Xanthobacteraceae bacterium]